MDSDAARNESVPSNVNMPRERGVARDNGALTDVTIVGHMAIAHDETPAPYSRGAVFVDASVNGGELADDAVVLDHRKARNVFELHELHVLGRTSEHGAFVDRDPRSEAQAGLQDDMRADASAFTDLDVVLDDDVGSDLDIGGDPYLRAHDGGAVGRH